MSGPQEGVSRGDRCIAFHICLDCFAEVSAALGVTARYRYDELQAFIERNRNAFEAAPAQ